VVVEGGGGEPAFVEEEAAVGGNHLTDIDLGGLTDFSVTVGGMDGPAVIAEVGLLFQIRSIGGIAGAGEPIVFLANGEHGAYKTARMENLNTKLCFNVAVGFFREGDQLVDAPGFDETPPGDRIDEAGGYT
jgi:hypothetical protein